MRFFCEINKQSTNKEIKEYSERKIIAKTLNSRNKTYFKLSTKINKHYTYGYFLVHNGHLTSFTAWLLKKKVCPKCLLGTENLQATIRSSTSSHKSSNLQVVP